MTVFKNYAMAFAMLLASNAVFADVVTQGTPQRESDRAEVYILKNGQKHWIPNEQVLSQMGYRASDVNVIPPGTLSSYKEGFPCIPNGSFFQFQGLTKVYKSIGDPVEVRYYWIRSQEWTSIGSPVGKIIFLPARYESWIH